MVTLTPYCGPKPPPERTMDFPAPYRLTGEGGPALADRLNSSMALRRQFAWDVAARTFAPTLITAPSDPNITIEVPSWHTWYTLKDFIHIFERFIAAQKNSSGQSLEDLIARVIWDYDVTRWTRIGQKLQTIATLNLSPEEQTLRMRGAVGGLAFMLFSPALIRHYLKNAERIRQCRNEFFPSYLSKDQLNPENLPKDEANVFALCFDHEFPQDAVMVKSSW